jgi:hypothetical protein
MSPEMASTLEELQAQVAKLKRTRDKLLVENQELAGARQAQAETASKYRELKVGAAAALVGAGGGAGAGRSAGSGAGSAGWSAGGAARGMMGGGPGDVQCEPRG